MQRFSLDDGPGIRTTVFFKGCNLRCRWCHNPESWQPAPEVMEYPVRCIGCGRCLILCPAGAHQMVDGRKLFRRELCQVCGKCVGECYAGALSLTGSYMGVDDVLREVERDRAFYESSGGGVTFSGGEPLLQKDFLTELLIECKKRAIHTAVDTAGNLPWAGFEAILPYTDLFLYDIKVMDEKAHREFTGAGLEMITGNLAKLTERRAEVIVRTPVIPGVNNSRERMAEIIKFLRGLEGIGQVELLAYHQMGKGKYDSLGLEYRMNAKDAVSREEMEALGAIVRESGFRVVVA